MEKQVINGKVVKGWFRRGKKPIPIFEDGTVGTAQFEEEDPYKTPYIKEKELEEYLKAGGTVYRGLHDNAMIINKTKPLVYEPLYLIQRRTWAKWLLSGKIARSDKRNEYELYEYKLK